MQNYFKICKIRKDSQSILEGESLLNDASSLIIFRFALIAVQQDNLYGIKQLSDFMDVCRRAGWGFNCFLLAKMHKLLPTDANIWIPFSPSASPLYVSRQRKNFTLPRTVGRKRWIAFISSPTSLS